MRSKTTSRFRKRFKNLPVAIQRQARLAYQIFTENPQHPSLNFKLIHRTESIYSVRINRQYRAICAKDGNILIWFWIGSHADYDELLKQF